MLEQIEGIINGKQIELTHETALPAGSIVLVTIEPKFALTRDEKVWLVNKLVGAWSGDNSISSIFAEIEQQRVQSMPRPVNFDVAS